jgi:hypothetical protein
MQAAVAADLHRTPIVLSCTAFRGCYQLVYEVLAAADGGEPDGAVQEQLQLAIEQTMQEIPGWSVSFIQQGIHGDAELSLKPLTVPWEVVLAAHKTSSRSSETSATAAADALDEAKAAPVACPELVIHSNTVQQLLAAGSTSLRVVVAAQPSGVLLLDRHWELPQAVAAGDGSMRLQLPLDGELMRQEVKEGSLSEVLVLSVVVLAGGNSTTTTTTTSSATAKAGAAPSTSRSSSEAGGKEASLVLASIPLLVLPPGACQEIEEVFEAALDAGMMRDEAYRLLLPLLQDWVALLLWQGPGGGAGLTAADLETCYQGQQAAVAALSEYFTRFGMVECHRLLLQQQQKLAGQAVHGESELGMREGCKTGFSAWLQQLRFAATIGSEAGAGGLKRRNVSSQDAAGGAISRSPPRPSAGKLAADGKTKPSSIMSEIVGAGLPGCDEASAAYSSLPRGLSVGLRSVLFGFPAPVQTAYLQYKASSLQRQDLVLTCVYVIGVVVGLVKLALVLCQQWATDQPFSLELVAVAVTRVGLAACGAAPNVLLWAVIMGQRRWPLLAYVLQWRGVVLEGSLVLQIWFSSFCFGLQGVWGYAISKLIGGYHASAVVCFLYNHVAQPFLVRPGPGGMLLHMAALFMWAYPMSGWPVLPTLGKDASWRLAFAVNVVTVVLLELRMQHTFVRVHARAVRN